MDNDDNQNNKLHLQEDVVEYIYRENVKLRVRDTGNFLCSMQFTQSVKITIFSKP